VAIRVVRYDMDPLKSGKTRDRWDFNLRRASARLVLSGSVAGMVLTIQSPVATAPAIVITEGVEWNEVGGDVMASMYALIAAIDVAAGELLRVNGRVELVAGNAEVTLEAHTPGSWGEQIELDIDAAGANLSINGNAGPTTELLTNGAGPDSAVTFQAFLNALPGTPTIAEIIIVPLTTESSSFLVIWDDTP